MMPRAYYFAYRLAETSDGYLVAIGHTQSMGDKLTLCREDNAFRLEYQNSGQAAGPAPFLTHIKLGDAATLRWVRVMDGDGVREVRVENLVSKACSGARIDKAKTKNWEAWIDVKVDTPCQLNVRGEVRVQKPGVQVVLRKVPIQQDPEELTLELVVEPMVPAGLMVDDSMLLEPQYSENCQGVSYTTIRILFAGDESEVLDVTAVF